LVIIIKREGMVYSVDPYNIRLILIFLRTDKEETLLYIFIDGLIALQL
jgi:hypothetical protein